LGFGYDVDVICGWPIDVIGVAFDPSTAPPRTGGAYIYERGSGGAWELTSDLIPALGQPADDCGLALALDAAVVPSAGGDVIAYQGLIGCPRALRFAEYTGGAAYLFRRLSQSDWGGGSLLLPDDDLIPGDRRNGELFGSALDLHGTTVVVGAPRDVNGGFERGAAYFYTGTDQRKKLIPQDLSTGAFFGQSVSIDPWFLVIGAFADDIPVSLAGSAYVYGLWGPIDFIGGSCCVITDFDARLTLAREDDVLGFSVRVETPFLLATVPGHDQGPFNTGAVALFRLASYPDDWSLLGLVQPTIDIDGAEGAESPVAMAGSTIFSGAKFDDVPGPMGSNLDSAGSVFAWEVDLLKPLFVDGFESGNLSRWSKVQP
jgi:hypothetical protein